MCKCVCTIEEGVYHDWSPVLSIAFEFVKLFLRRIYSRISSSLLFVCLLFIREEGYMTQADGQKDPYQQSVVSEWILHQFIKALLGSFPWFNLICVLDTSPLKWRAQVLFNGCCSRRKGRHISKLCTVFHQKTQNKLFSDQCLFQFTRCNIKATACQMVTSSGDATMKRRKGFNEMQK